MRHVSICIALALIVAHCSFGEQAESQYPTLNVAKLGSFKGETPYELHGDGEETRLKFVNRGPLPVVNVRINGGDEVTFFIDTGGSELGLDTERECTAVFALLDRLAAMLSRLAPRSP